MFILLNTGAMLNLFWLQDCFQGKHDKNIVIFYMINGSKIIEEYATAALAEARVIEVRTAMFNFRTGLVIKKVDVLPAVGETGVIYLVPKAGTSGDVYDEYIWVDNKWEHIGTTEAKFDDYYTKEQIHNLLANYYLKTEVDALFLNYYLKTEVDALVAWNEY